MNKFSCLDPEGMGIEMEAGKPGWNDAMNGLPGLMGSGLSQTLELKRPWYLGRYCHPHIFIIFYLNMKWKKAEAVQSITMSGTRDWNITGDEIVGDGALAVRNGEISRIDVFLNKC